MAIKVTVGTLINTNQVLIQLANAPLPPKAKYWLGRIATQAHGRLMEYEKKRIALVMEMGHPVRLEPQPSIEIDGVMTPQQPKPVEITDPEEAKKPNTMWDVRDDRMADFTAQLEILQAEVVEIPFNRIPLDGFGDVPVAANLSALEWAIEA